jgi:hypothetical protein
MKALCAGLMALSLAALVGCGGPSTTSPHATSKVGGTPSTDASATHHGIGEILPGLKKGEFELTVPRLLAVSIEQGETKTEKIGISRGENFDEDVKLDFSGAPKGVKITADPAEIKKGAKDTQVKIEAAKDAAPGKHTIEVTGTPTKGNKSVRNFDINVKERK